MNRLSGFQIMKRLILELKTLVPVMMITITMGVLGFLAAIFIAGFASLALGSVIEGSTIISFKLAIIFMLVLAVMRGLLRYVEQLSGHYIAFKILLILRDKTFTVLRKLAPAKLETKDKGNLISLITSDIELLEVFYAHTIAPIAIAILTNSIIVLILGRIHLTFGVLSAIYFLIIGLVIPYISSRHAKVAGVEYRNEFGKGNAFILDSLRGLREIIFFNQGTQRLKLLDEKSSELNKSVAKIKQHDALVSGVTDVIILIAILSFVGIGFYYYALEELSLSYVLFAIVIIASSFGPVVALSHLSNNLVHTFACAQRLFDLLDEAPQVEEIVGERQLQIESITYDDVTFRYPNGNDPVLENMNLRLKRGDKIALIGESGIGKSTFVKLLMRYFDPSAGQILIDNQSLDTIPTAALRANQSLMSQDTYLFNASISDNLKIAKPKATLEELIEASKKASIHEFIMSLPNGYETVVGELGGMLSSGERQRLGLARAFLHDADILILDEPSSNLDTLNEAEILKSIKNYGEEKTIILISHRKSTTAVTSQTYRLENKKMIKN